MGRRPHGAQLCSGCVLPCPARGVARSQEYLRTPQKQLDPAENHMLRTAHTVPMHATTDTYDNLVIAALYVQELNGS